MHGSRVSKVGNTEVHQNEDPNEPLFLDSCNFATNGFFLDYCNFATTGLFNFFFHISRALLFPKSILNHYKLVAYKMVSKKEKKQTKKLQRAYSRMMLSA